MENPQMCAMAQLFRSKASVKKKIASKIFGFAFITFPTFVPSFCCVYTFFLILFHSFFLLFPLYVSKYPDPHSEHFYITMAMNFALLPHSTFTFQRLFRLLDSSHMSLLTRPGICFEHKSRNSSLRTSRNAERCAQKWV